MPTYILFYILFFPCYITTTLPVFEYMIKIKKTNQLEKERIKKNPAIDFLITEKRAHFKKEENTEKSGQLYAISLFGPSINSITSLLGLFIWAKLGL